MATVPIPLRQADIAFANRRTVDAGQFGWCVETGEPIGVDRLLICPTATLCFEAQQLRESITRRYRV